MACFAIERIRARVKPHETSIDSNLGVLLRAGTDEMVPDKLVNTIRARKVPNNATEKIFTSRKFLMEAVLVSLTFRLAAISSDWIIKFY
jgi:hypothetical protein